MKDSTRPHGFTLIELMIVVAIVSILAAIAIPQFRAFIARTKRVEAVETLQGVYKAQMAYYSTTDQFLAAMTQQEQDHAEQMLGIDRSQLRYFALQMFSSCSSPLMSFWTGLVGNIDDDSNEEFWMIKGACPDLTWFDDGIAFLEIDDLRD